MISFKFKNLGSISSGEINLNKLTVLCGENNTGKTYATYAMYGLFKENTMGMYYDYINKYNFSDDSVLIIDLEKIIEDLDELLRNMSEKYSNELYELFSVSKKSFNNTLVELKINKEKLKEKLYLIEKKEDHDFKHFKIITKKKKNSFNYEFIFNYPLINKENFIEISKILVSVSLNELLFSDSLNLSPFLLPAERSGLNLFYKELNINRNEIVHGLGNEYDIENLKISLNKRIGKYSTPISDYINFLNELEDIAVEASEYEYIAQKIERNIIKGNYNLKNNNINYTPQKINKDMDNTSISLHVSSSTVKTLFGLVFYLTYVAEKGSILFIDEPELNLHPDNQREMAKILVEIANAGINVVISTHSDYLLKEFSNLIMLNNDFAEKQNLMDQFNYTSEQLLNYQDISAYVFEDHIIKPMEINTTEGIIPETFNKVINQSNQANDAIYYALMENHDEH